jgi:hypothetical protein
LNFFSVRPVSLPHAWFLCKSARTQATTRQKVSVHIEGGIWYAWCDEEYVPVAVEVGRDGEADGDPAGGGEPGGSCEVDGREASGGGGLDAVAGGDAVGGGGGELVEHAEAVAAEAVGRHPGRARQVGHAGQHQLRHLPALQRTGGGSQRGQEEHGDGGGAHRRRSNSNLLQAEDDELVIGRYSLPCICTVHKRREGGGEVSAMGVSAPGSLEQLGGTTCVTRRRHAAHWSNSQRFGRNISRQKICVKKTSERNRNCRRRTGHVLRVDAPEPMCMLPADPTRRSLPSLTTWVAESFLAVATGIPVDLGCI